MAEDALLFIDANIYLDLYERAYRPLVLSQLAELSTIIFSTQQVVDEVRRRKNQVAANAIEKAFQQIAKTTIEKSIPEHLLSQMQFLDLTNWLTSVPKFNNMINSYKIDLKEQIDRQEDSVSRTLAPIFRNSKGHTSAEFERARERRDRGNPPGKGATLGDQLNWEQLLGRFRGKTKIWIISRDGDYGTFSGDKGLLHQFLIDELCAISPAAEAHLFGNLAEGIQDFKNRSGVSPPEASAN